MTKFLTKPIFFVLLACLAAAIGWGGIATVKVADLRTELAEMKLAHTQAKNSALLNLQERVATLSTDLMEAQSAHATTKSELADARNNARTRGQRVRNEAAGDSLDQRIAAAECTVARAFAAGSFRAAAACRDHLAEIGLGSGGLVEASASASYEHGRAEALMRFVMPRSPFNPATKE